MQKSSLHPITIRWDEFVGNGLPVQSEVVPNLDLAPDREQTGQHELERVLAPAETRREGPQHVWRVNVSQESIVPLPEGESYVVTPKLAFL